MFNKAIKIWELSKEGSVREISLSDSSSLDAITRQLPQGYYTTFRTYDGGKRTLGLHAHLKRLYDPADAQGINPAVPTINLRQDLADLLRNYPNEARVRLILAKDGRVYVAIEPLKPLPPEIYSHGVKVVTTDMERQNPRLKSTSFISASQGTRDQIAGNKVFEGLLVRNGFILEGMTSNFFYIKDGQVGTAHRDILLGVTRRIVLQVTRGSGLDIVYKPLKREQVPALDESFLTSSSRGIVPIVQIDEIPVGEERPGLMTKRLSEAYNEYVVRHAELISFDVIKP